MPTTELPAEWAIRFHSFHKKEGEENYVTPEQRAQIKAWLLERTPEWATDVRTVVDSPIYLNPDMSEVKPPMPYPDAILRAVDDMSFKRPVVTEPGYDYLGHVVYMLPTADKPGRAVFIQPKDLPQPPPPGPTREEQLLAATTCEGFEAALGLPMHRGVIAKIRVLFSDPGDRLKLAQRWLELGGDPNKKSVTGRLPLGDLVWDPSSGTQEMMNLLLDHGAKCDYPEDGEWPEALRERLRAARPE